MTRTIRRLSDESAKCREAIWQLSELWFREVRVDTFRRAANAADFGVFYHRQQKVPRFRLRELPH